MNVPKSSWAALGSPSVLGLPRAADREPSARLPNHGALSSQLCHERYRERSTGAHHGALSSQLCHERYRERI